jgi:O-6-methylguanine DNA methyltransferase
MTNRVDKVDFCAEVYTVVASIPSGSVLTYGQIASLVGRPQCSRMVGQAMHNAPSGLPCHRVVNSQGRLAPFWVQQRELLEKEDVAFKKNGCVDLKKSCWDILGKY